MLWFGERNAVDARTLQAPIADARRARVVVDDPAHGIATEQNAVGAEQHVGALEDVGVDGDGILQVTAPVNGIVHPHTIDNKQHAVGFEPLKIGDPPPCWLC